MTRALEQRLNDLVHEIKEIKKQVVSEKSIQVSKTAKWEHRWKLLVNDVTLKWKGPSPVEEIRKQREKIY